MLRSRGAVGLQAEREGSMKHTKCAIGLFLGTLLYAVVRYNVFGDVAWANVPLYVCNKALSWTGLILFGLSVVSCERADRRGYGTLAVGATTAHVVMSALVLNPVYFAKFYAASGRMNGVGETSMLAGVAGAMVLWALFVANMGSHGPGASLRAGWGRAVLVCSGVHVFVMGFAGWLTPWSWPGYLPPITLISFLATLYFLYRRRRDSRSGG